MPVSTRSRASRGGRGERGVEHLPGVAGEEDQGEPGQRPVDAPVPGGDARLVLHHHPRFAGRRPASPRGQGPADVGGGPANENRTQRCPSTGSKSIPGGERDAGLGQQPVGPVHRVVREVRRRRRRRRTRRRPGRSGHPEPAQAVEQQRPVRRVPGDVPVGLGVASGVKAATAACWASAGGQIVKLPVSRSTARRSRSGARAASPAATRSSRSTWRTS